MSRVWVLNASPLILLGKIDQVVLLRELSDKLIVPDRVVREVGARPAGERVISEVASFPGARFEAEVATSAELAAWNLGSGETQVLALAGAAQGSEPWPILGSSDEVRQAVWQTYLSKAGSDAADALEAAARGESIHALLHRFAHKVHPEVYRRLEGDLRWHFMRQA